MDFRAVKIILAVFLLISFATPIFRLSASMPKKGKETSPLALANSKHSSDSTATAPLILTDNGDR